MQIKLNLILFILLSFGRLYSLPSEYLDEFFKNSKELEVSELLGGLSGAKNYKVSSSEKDYVLRILNPLDDIEQRQKEIQAATSAGMLNIGPVIYYVDPFSQAMLMDFVPGQTVNREVWDNKENLKEFLYVMKQLHECDLDFPIGCTLFERTRMQLESLQASDIPFPKVALSHALKKLKEIEDVFKNEPLVPCHNDLNSLNVIHEGLTFKIIDWTDAGFGSLYQDLSGFILASGKDAKGQKEILELYFGYPPSSQQLYMFRLMKEVVVLSIFSAGYPGFQIPIKDEDLRSKQSMELEKILWEKELSGIDYFLDLHAQGKLNSEMMLDVTLCALRSFLKDQIIFCPGF